MKAHRSLICLLFVLAYLTIQVSLIAMCALINMFFSGDIVYVAKMVSDIYGPAVRFALWISRSNIIKHDILGAMLIHFIAIGLYSIPLGIITFRMYEYNKVKKIRKIAMGFCAICDYNLKGNKSGICPECGTAFDPKILTMKNNGGDMPA